MVFFFYLSLNLIEYDYTFFKNGLQSAYDMFINSNNQIHISFHVVVTINQMLFHAIS